jgi:hypothetical protein
MTSTNQTLPLATAVGRLQADHDLLLARIDQISGEELVAAYRPAAGPLGDFCESLHDVIAYVLMWDELNLAVLTEAAADRSHWSLSPRWETPDAGRRLNRGGVEAGRHIPTLLLLHRFRAVRDALLAEFAGYDERTWARPTPIPAGDQTAGGSLGELAQRVWTVPGNDAFWHAAIHLNQLPAEPAEA